MRISELAMAAAIAMWACGGEQPAQQSSETLPGLQLPPRAATQPHPQQTPRRARSKPAPAPVAAHPAAPASAAKPAPKGSWFCFRAWDATNPKHESTGCARSEGECGRARWQQARALRNRYGTSIETRLCEPHQSVVCFHAVPPREDEPPSCHPTADDCRLVRTETLKDSDAPELSQCAPPR